jgi:hypothetical protein
LSARITPAHWGLEPRAFDEALELIGDDEPLTEQGARDEAAIDLFRNLGGCIDTIRNALPDGDVIAPINEHGEFFSDEADFGDAFAVLLQASCDQHILQAVYRLRELIERSPDGREFIADRAKELLAEEAKRLAAGREEAEAMREAA